MGTQRLYNYTGGFSQYLYHQVGNTITAPNGMQGKIIESIAGDKRDNLPTFSNTGEIYLRRDATGQITQMRIYKNRRPIKDFDFNHEHKNPKDGEIFPKGTVHVQEWKQKPNGDYYRDSKNARKMTQKEIDKYGEFILYINPRVLF